MPKGYWIGRVDVKNEEGYKPYAAANGRSSRNSAAASSSAAASPRCVGRQRRARAMW